MILKLVVAVLLAVLIVSFQGCKSTPETDAAVEVAASALVLKAVSDNPKLLPYLNAYALLLSQKQGPQDPPSQIAGLVTAVTHAYGTSASNEALSAAIYEGVFEYANAQ